VDDSVWMAGAGSSVLDRVVIILLVLGVSTAVVFVCLHMRQAELRLLRWAIRRPFHRCAACHARTSSVALWSGLQGGSPNWLCAECVFGVQDFDQLPRSRRQRSAQIAGRVEHMGRAAAFWAVPTVGGGGRHRRTTRRPYDLASPPVMR